MSNRLVDVSWSRAGEGVTLLVFVPTEHGKLREVQLVFDSLHPLSSDWSRLLAAIEKHGGEGGRARVLLPSQKSWARLIAASSKPRT